MDTWEHCNANIKHDCVSLWQLFDHTMIELTNFFSDMKFVFLVFDWVFAIECGNTLGIGKHHTAPHCTTLHHRQMVNSYMYLSTSRLLGGGCVRRYHLDNSHRRQHGLHGLYLRSAAQVERTHHACHTPDGPAAAMVCTRTLTDTPRTVWQVG